MTGVPLASPQGLNRYGRFIYVGTFSKILLPSMRLGYIVVPGAVADAYAARFAPALASDGGPASS